MGMTLGCGKRKSNKRDRAAGLTANRSATDPPRGGAHRWWQSGTRITVLAAMAAIAVGGLTSLFLFHGGYPPFGPGGAGVVTPAAFVGSEACTGCHQAETELWKGSQHKHAMQHASAATVLGNFEDTSFDYYGVHSRFFKKDGKFVVETDGPDGKLATFEIKYTFGIDPLQQYLVEFPDGRLQALSIAWDTRPKDKGGQRWFHLYPKEEIKHDDILHWTKLNQNWNFMCAECHSTGVKKNYDAANDRFGTTWAELSVGCEACHGKGSRHVSWAKNQRSWWPFGKSDDPVKGLVVLLNERDGITWLPDPRTGNPQRSIAPALVRREVETCGLCHARRGEFSEDWIPGRSLSDTHVVSTLARGLYHADGQMLDEVYNYGSFKQSKMFAAGVTCSDCHEPHAAKLRAPGDGVCLQCHASGKYEVATHHHHERANPARDLCIMPYARQHLYGDRQTARSQSSNSKTRSLCQSLERPTPVTAATPTNRRNGQPPRSSSGMGPTEKVFRTTPKRSRRPGAAAPMRRRFLQRSLQIRRRRRSRGPAP